MKRLLVLASLLVVHPFAAFATEDEAAVLRGRAAVLAQEGKCAEATPLLERAIAADPRDAQAGLLLGRCQIQGKDYAGAEKTLGEAARRDPAQAEVQLELAVARYHQENFAGARSALDAAGPKLSGDARYQLYNGMLLLHEGKRSEAIAALDRARQIDAKAVEPTASYFAGLALENQGERTEARQAMDRVVAINPVGPWGTAARSRLDQWAFGRDKDYWASATFGYESDSNVVLRGQGVTLPSDITDESDWRWIWNANAGYEFLRTEDWGAGAVDYTGTHQHKLDEFDYHYVVGTGWLDRRIVDNLSAHLQGDYAYGWVDSDSYVSEVAATPALDYTWAPNSYSRLFGRFYWTNYYFDPDSGTAYIPPPGYDAKEERNRDGHGEMAGFEQGIPLYAIQTQLTATAYYTRYHAEGSEYSFRGAGGFFTTETLLPLDFTLRTLGSFVYRGYLNNTSFESVPPVGPPPTSDKRRDQISDVEVALEHPLIWDWLLVSGRWHYTHADSTVEVFDYDRIIYGAYFTVELP
jgi:tetratricopeptide (TPR) repeat protein